MMRLTRRSAFLFDHSGLLVLQFDFRILDTVSDAGSLARLPVDKFTDLFVKA